MKKIIAFFTKGSKIRNILIYVYRGLVVAKAAFEAGFAALKVERPEDDAYAKLENIPEYLDAAAKAVKKILEWIGEDTHAIEEMVDRDGQCINCGNNFALREITDGLKRE